MGFEEYFDRFRKYVDKEGNQPIDVWNAFKECSQYEIESEDDFLLVQVGDSDVMEESYLDLCREVNFENEDGDSWGIQIHAEFKCELPVKLGCEAVDCMSNEYKCNADFFSVVESMPEFKAALIFDKWSFEIYAEEI